MLNWLNKKWKKFKKKSPRQKLFDLLFLALIAVFLIPGGRIQLQRLLLKTGVYNAQVNEQQREFISDEDLSNLKFVDANSETHALSEYKGRVVFINYWATWCPPCKAEIPSLSALYDKLKDEKDIQFLFLTFEKIPVVQQFEAEWELNFKSHFMTQNPPQSLQAEGLPTTIILDKKGQVVLRHTGMANWDNEDIYQQLNSLITE